MCVKYFKNQTRISEDVELTQTLYMLQLPDVFLLLFFQLLRGERIQIPLKEGHHRPARETPCKWHFAGWLMMAQH